MSKKKYSYDAGKYIGCNKTHGWLLSADQIGAVRFYMSLAGLKFLLNAKSDLSDGMPKDIVLHEMRKYREVTSLYNDLDNLKPYAYVRA